MKIESEANALCGDALNADGSSKIQNRYHSRLSPKWIILSVLF
jgi:hypothetical protein